MDWSPGYREWAPPAALAGSISCLWVSVIGEGAEPTVVLPDACADLIWQQGRGLFAAGPDTGPSPTPLPAGTALVGARFAPGAGGPALAMPLSALLDQRVDAADLGCAAGAGLARALPGSLPPDRALRALVSAVAGLVADGPADPAAAAAARALDRPRQAVGVVAAGLALSDRQLRRRCEAAVGYGPATLRRVLRFRRFVSRVDAGQAACGLAALAADAGYADQAHLTRECVEFAGMTPSAMAALRGPVGTAAGRRE